jgi:cytochrome P450 family 142 subfamily A polypeptide 1
MMMQLDIMDAQTWGDGVWDRLRWLRENDPIHWDEKNQLWVLSKYEDVLYVSKHHRIFCSGEGVRPNMPVKLSMLDMDEPRHTQLRSLVNRGFTPRQVAKLEVFFRKLVTETIDQVADRGTCDFVTDIAVRRHDRRRRELR